MIKCDTSQTENGIAVTKTHCHKMGSSPSSITYLTMSYSKKGVWRPMIRSIQYPSEVIQLYTPPPWSYLPTWNYCTYVFNML